MEATSQPEAEEEVAAAAAAAEEEEEEEEKGEKIRKKYIKKEEERKKRPLPHSPPVSTQWTISTNGPVRMRSRRDAHPATRCFLLLPPLPSLPPSISIFFFLLYNFSLLFVLYSGWPEDRKAGRPGGGDRMLLNWIEQHPHAHFRRRLRRCRDDRRWLATESPHPEEFPEESLQEFPNEWK